jgi:hypothetical protein
MLRPLTAMLLLLMACSAPVGQAPETVSSPQIDPRAEEIMRAVCDGIQSRQSARIEVVDTIEEVDEIGQRVHYSHVRSLTYQRPGRLRIESAGDIHNRSFWKDGRTVTIYDADQEIYAQIDDPGSIDDAIDVLVERYGISVPMADLISEDPCGVLLEGVQLLRYLGRAHVDGAPCHHLAFRRPDIDFQLWVDEGPEPAVRRLVITYKSLPGQPQYGMTIKSRLPLAFVPASTFTFVPTPDAELIELVPLDEEGER